MATPKQRSKISYNRDIKGESNDEESDVEVKEEILDPEDEVSQESSDDLGDNSFEIKSEDDDDMDLDGSPQSGSMSLDMLAQVASARLEKDPGSSKPSKSNAPKNFAKISKRSLLNMDFLHLDQIRTLSPKFLVNLFGEMNSNEITRNYSFTCYIMPEKCSTQYSSFGSEIKARDLMKYHLMKHVDELIKLKSANEGFSFIAETVVAKKKREIAEKSMRRRKTAWSLATGKTKKPPSNTKPSKVKSPNSIKKFTGLKSPKSTAKSGSKNGEKSILNPAMRKKNRPTSPTSTITTLEGDFPAVVPEGDYALPGDIENDHIYPENKKKADGEWDIIEERKLPFKRTGRNVERNENIIWDILSSSQPYHDHSYTTVFGKRKAGQAFEDIAMLELEEDEQDEDSRLSARTSGLKFATSQLSENEGPLESKPIMLKVGDTVQNKMHIPIIKVEFTPSPDNSTLVSPEVMGHSINRPYPPMPKSELALKGRLKLPEEQVSSSEEEVVPAIISPTKKHKRKFKEGSLEWERRLSLKCIRELRLRKKEEDTRLACKICKDKTFTATATLMYHYRSHAGIKPFVCLICNTTFTRQHSLNYHMLIHNNQSRFTCVDCGRKFRHPSHFKEHLRRHTGETPFHCMDCPVRFKTRNTYKRHLKTRHGKLLTANGIRLMPREEFLKVRTKYAKYAKRGALDEDYNDEVEDEEDDMDIDPDAEIDPDGLDSEKEDVDFDPNPDEIKDVEVGGNVSGINMEVLQANNVTSLIDSSASSKLLQLCSQVVQQEAG